MTDDLDFQESLDRYFEIEAAELLQTIEHTLYQLVEEKTVERVHTLMRSAHTIKGSAANCGFKTIETIAHHLEDVFQALYPEELEIDPQLGLLLLEGYECLSEPLSAMLAGVPYDEAATLERTAELFARLQTHLGDFFGRETPLPTAAELGFDVIGSIFTDSVPQDLEVLAEAIAGQNEARVSQSLSALAEFLSELGGSYSLPGIEAIATATMTALKSHPDRVLELAPIALANFQQAQIAILGGDRSVGGEVSLQLSAWANGEAIATAPTTAAEASTRLSMGDDTSDRAELLQLDAAEDWLSLVAASPAPAVAEVDTTDDAADWLSMVNDDSDANTVEPTTDDAADWLSMVDDDSDANIVEPTTDDAADWLSMVDDDSDANTVEPTTDDAAEWLSMVNDGSDVSVEPTADDAAEWLSMVNDDSDVEQNESCEDDAEVEVGTFEEATVSSSALARQPEYIPAEQSPGGGLVLSSLSGVDRILQSIALEQPIIDALPETAPATPTERTTPDNLVSVRVATAQLERLSHTIGELSIDDNQLNLRAEQLQILAKAALEQQRRCEQKLRLVGDWADKNTLTGDLPQFSSSRSKGRTKKAKKASPKAASEVQSQFDSIELDVYNDLSILLQQLTDDLAALGLQVEDLAEMTQKAKLTQGKRQQLLAEAQAELFNARMVEISTVFNRFPRLLQQMVATHRKPAQLELVGTTVSIDKIIADKLYDPLLHLVRNAYDHGVEPPEVRAQQGKPETGTLTIKAYHQGNHTTIEVRDDGQGLNWPKIRQRAVDMKLLTADRAATATETELAEIMFAPGFSTADKVNDLSGRGIGLDVVRDRIGALQGTIDVRSVPGRGTTFVMQFPLDLTTARLLICESQGVVHALRSEAIAQVLLPTPERIQTQSSLSERGTAKFFRWSEGAAQQMIPIYPVNALLTYNCPLIEGAGNVANLFPATTKNSGSALLLLEVDGDRICLEVDRILVEQELVVKSLGLTFGLPNYIQGYSVLGDGSLTLAIDPVELLAQVRNRPSDNYAPPSNRQLLPQAVLAPASDTNEPIDAEIVEEPSAPSQRKPIDLGRQLQVLVIDDSIVQRQMLTRSLTKAGCQVVQASHGREGLLRLQEHPRIRLIVCDIEMPQMNGFEFLSHCRQDAKLSQIPIVMLTTRGGQKHRQLAMTLGAKNYLTKPQSEKDLLEIVAKLSQQEVGV